MFKSFLHYWQNRKQPRYSSVGRHPVPFRTAKDIGVLFNDRLSNQSDAINGFVNHLMLEGKRVRALTYFERAHSNPYDFKFDFFTKKELSPFGGIRNEKVDQFTDFVFDYLFCINFESFAPFDTILQKSKAKFRVGTYMPDKEKYYEVMIKPAEGASLPLLLEQMYQYTLLLTADER